MIASVPIALNLMGITIYNVKMRPLSVLDLNTKFAKITRLKNKIGPRAHFLFVETNRGLDCITGKNGGRVGV